MSPRQSAPLENQDMPTSQLRLRSEFHLRTFLEPAQGEAVPASAGTLRHAHAQGARFGMSAKALALGDATRRDPYPLYTRLRDHEPVSGALLPGMVAVSR